MVQDEREAAARHPEFFQAFRLLRGLSLHMRTHLSRLVEAQRAARGEAICSAEEGGAALVLVLEGEARIDAGESLLAQMRVREGQTFGEEVHFRHRNFSRPALISHKVFLKSFFRSQFPHKFVNLSFIIA